MNNSSDYKQFIHRHVCCFCNTTLNNNNSSIILIDPTKRATKKNKAGCCKECMRIMDNKYTYNEMRQIGWTLSQLEVESVKRVEFIFENSFSEE
jgi:hypothetical protein